MKCCNPTVCAHISQENNHVSTLRVLFKMDLTSILQATPARKVTTPAVAEEEEEWVSSTSSPGGSRSLVMMMTKKPRVQTKMSNSVSETSQVTHPIPPPSSSSPWIHVMCERALTLFKAVIIKSPSILPTPNRPTHPPINPKCFQRCCVTRNDDENRDEVEEKRTEGKLSFGGRIICMPPPTRIRRCFIKKKAEASSVFLSPTAGCSGDERGVVGSR